MSSCQCDSLTNHPIGPSPTPLSLLAPRRAPWTRGHAEKENIVRGDVGSRVVIRYGCQP